MRTLCGCRTKATFNLVTMARSQSSKPPSLREASAVVVSELELVLVLDKPRRTLTSLTLPRLAPTNLL